MPERFLQINEVRDRVTLSKTQIYRLIRAGTFPEPVPLGPHRTAFLESEVQDWMQGRVRARERGEGAAGRRQRAADAVAERDRAQT